MDMQIMAVLFITHGIVGIVGAVITAAVIRNERRKARERRGNFIASRNRSLNASRELEQSVVRLSRAMKRSGITGVTVFKGKTPDSGRLIGQIRGDNCHE